MNILIVGSGAREHALAKALKASPQSPDLYCYGTNSNPGIRQLTTAFRVGSINDVSAVTDFALLKSIELTVVGPEAPLAAGLVDILQKNGIGCVGPTKNLAQIETSKGFTRRLLTKYGIPANPKYKFFHNLQGVQSYLGKLGNQYVVKFDGLMGGKGVKVADEHLHSHSEALNYCRALVDKGGFFVIEEKLVGQEFSLMSFSDGEHLAHMPPVQDHKRAFVGDTGPNTGGMGSYLDADHSLPFLTDDDVKQAHFINEATIKALKAEFEDPYRGILYGGFIVTRDGVRLIEYNARFGDPEGMNVLAILKSDFVTICRAIINGNLSQNLAQFDNKATVCKYAVPKGYPDAPVKDQLIDVSEVRNVDQLYYASVDARNDVLYEAGSRTVAYVGIADTLEEAEAEAEAEISKVIGPLFHREDIGTKELIRKRVEHMKSIRN